MGNRRRWALDGTGDNLRSVTALEPERRDSDARSVSRAPLRVLWVLSKLDWNGGIGRVVAGTAREFARRGHEVHVAGPAPDGVALDMSGVEIHAWPRRRWKFRRIAPLIALQRRIGAHVIHFHSALPHGEVILALRVLRGWLGAPRILVTAHSSRPYPKRRARLGLRIADAVVLPSKWSADKAIEAGARPETTHVVPGGVDPVPPSSRTREPVVVSLGRLVPIKGIDLLIDAFDRVAAERPEWRLRIGGEGPESEALRERARRARCADRIELLGYVRGEAKRQLLESAAIGALPSSRESFGGAVLEFQAHGLACVAARVGAIPELADGGKAAKLVPAGDVAALAAALAELMDRPELRRELSAAARSFASGFAWPAIAERLERLYRG